MAIRRNSTINWKNNSNVTDFKLKPVPFFTEVPWLEQEPSFLVVGSMWTIKHVLGPLYWGKLYRTHDRAYLCRQGFQSKGSSFQSGTPAIYMGTFRVEEESSGGKMMSVLRHSFLVGCTPYITTDLNDYQWVSHPLIHLHDTTNNPTL